MNRPAGDAQTVSLCATIDGIGGEEPRNPTRPMNRESIQPSYKLFSQAPGFPVTERGWKDGEGAACSWVEEAKLADPHARHWYRPWVRSPF